MGGARILAGLAVALLLGAAGPAAAADKPKCNLQLVAELPVTLSGLRPLVPVKINGRAVTLVADSGAFFSMLNETTAEPLALRRRQLPFGFAIQGVGGLDRNVGLGIADDIELAGQHVKNVQFLVGQIDVGAGSAGIMGQNILGFTDVEYDLANGAIRLWNPSNCDGLIPTYWAKPGKVSIVRLDPLSPRQPHLTGRAQINGQNIKVLFDTGFSHSSVELRAAKRLGFQPDAAGVEAGGVVRGVGSRVFESWIAPFDSFEFDNEKILNTRLRVSNMDLMMADMVLGVDFFLSHRIYISHKGHTLYATYNGGPVFRLDQAGRIAARQRSEAAAQPARAASPVGQAPSDAESFSRRGASFAARREFGRAIEDFSKAIQLDPDDPQRYVDRGYAHLSAGQPILAMADFDQALKLTPGDPKALVGRGAMFLSSRDLVRAKADLDAAIKAAPDSAATAFQVARMWSDAGQTGRALRVLDGWITAHPDAAELTQALNGRCRIRAMAGTDLDRALADCDVALRRGPKVAALYDTRGLVYLRMGQFDAAIDNYDDALKLQPRLGRAPYGRGVAKKAKGLESEGQADIAAAVGINPGLPQFFKRLGLETGAQARAPAAGAGQ